MLSACSSASVPASVEAAGAVSDALSPWNWLAISRWSLSVCSATAWLAKALARARASALLFCSAVTATMLLDATGNAETSFSRSCGLSLRWSWFLTRAATSTFVTSFEAVSTSRVGSALCLISGRLGKVEGSTGVISMSASAWYVFWATNT